MKKAQFDFNDYLDSMEQMRNMGGFASVLNMLPGMGGKMKDIESMVDEKDMARKEAIVLSMTPKERSNPDLLNPSRKQRIAKGAGVDIAEVNRFVKQFEQMRVMMKGMTDMKGLFGKMGGGMPDISKMGNLGGMGGFNGKLGKHAINKAMKMMRRFK